MTLAMYRRTTGFPKEEMFGLTRGSSLEVQTQLFLATELGYGNSVQLKTTDDLSNEVSKMLNSLLAKL